MVGLLGALVLSGFCKFSAETGLSWNSPLFRFRDFYPPPNEHGRLQRGLPGRFWSYDAASMLIWRSVSAIISLPKRPCLQIAGHVGEGQRAPEAAGGRPHGVLGARRPQSRGFLFGRTPKGRGCERLNRKMSPCKRIFVYMIVILTIRRVIITITIIIIRTSTIPRTMIMITIY